MALLPSDHTSRSTSPGPSLHKEQQNGQTLHPLPDATHSEPQNIHLHSVNSLSRQEGHFPEVLPVVTVNRLSHNVQNISSGGSIHFVDLQLGHILTSEDVLPSRVDHMCPQR